jgi:hypothetical protein
MPKLLPKATVGKCSPYSKVVSIIFRPLVHVAILCLLLGNGCASSRKPQSPESVLKNGEDLISLKAAVELARSAYSAGCVRTYIEQGKKGYFAECRKAADKFVEQDILEILNADPGHLKP